MKMMQRDIIGVTGLSLFMVVNLAQAGTMGALESQSSTWIPLLTLSLGPAWTEAGKTQSFYLQPDIQKTYSATKNTELLARGELFLAAQKSLSSSLIGQFGLALATTSNAKLSGDIWEDADPAFNNFAYDYAIQQRSVAAKAKILTDMAWPVNPYLSASLGLGFNKAYNFRIQSKLFQEIPAPAFQNHSSTSAAYSLGLGIQRALSSHWQAGLGYEFSAWGKSALARAPGQTLNTGLKLSNLYTNTVQLSLSFLK